MPSRRTPGRARSRTRSRSRNPFRLATAATILLVAACANDRSVAPTTTVPVDLGEIRLVSALEAFDACDAALDHIKGLALERVGPYGLDGGVIAFEDGLVSSRDVASSVEPATAAPAPSMDGAGAAGGQANSAAAEKSADATGAAGDAAAGGDTGTNNQEVGVDEADLVKRDGNRIVTVRFHELIVTELVDGVPTITARLDLGDEDGGFYAEKLFLLGDRAYVFGSSYSPTPISSSSSSSSSKQAGADSLVGGSSAIAVVEVSLAGSPTISGRRFVQGSLLDGRLADGTIRLVVTSPGGRGLGFVYPDVSERSEQRAEEANRKVIEESTIADWLPVVIDEAGNSSPLVPCERLYHPKEPSGFSTISIVTIADGLGSLTATGVLADGQITYASTDHLYVATNQWAFGARGNAASTEYTDVHAFTIAGSEPAAYQASGRVEGNVLNQYSMSEQGGDLRIATTVSDRRDAVVDCGPTASCLAPSTSGASQIVVLRPDGDVLRQIGKIGGLGPSETIQSVRYVGDTAYVVTFRQTDPFYVVDLSDPTAPRKLGELKVPGFSSYLHPVGNGLVLGVGSDATDEGRITGGKVSLYDTTDPADPRELDTETYRDLSFMAGSDAKAFTWDPTTKRVFLPYYGNCFDRCISQMPNGVLVLQLDGTTLTEVGTIQHPAPEQGQEQEQGQGGQDSPGVPVPATTTDDSGTVGPVETVEPAMSIAPYYQPMPTITRAIVVDGLVVTVSDVGIAAHTIDGLGLRGFARW